MNSTAAVCKAISAKLQQQQYKEAIELCQKAEKNPESDNSFLFWHIYGQCAVHCSEWSQAERHLVKAKLCESTQPQQQKNIKVSLGINAILHRNI